jgi:predicted O-methyltransferase YrrM
LRIILKLINILIFAFKSLFGRYSNIEILSGKIVSKFVEKKPTDEYFGWLHDNAINIESYCMNLDEQLWNESTEFEANLNNSAQMNIPDEILQKMGGAGACELLYFLVRKMSLNIIIETGVSLGYSSTALLEAIKKNGNGRLFSSDFPYPGLKDSDKYIGVLVPKEFRKDWVLKIKGDKYNLPEISEMAGKVDLIHYDSDKSFSGRKFALRVLEKNISSDTVIIMDDIHENTHFKQLVNKFASRPFKVFQFKNKYIGLIERSK